MTLSGLAGFAVGVLTWAVPGPETSACWATRDRLPWCSDVPEALIGVWRGGVTVYPPPGGTLPPGVTSWVTRLSVERGAAGDDAAEAVTTGLDPQGEDWGCTHELQLRSGGDGDRAEAVFDLVNAAANDPDKTTVAGSCRPDLFVTLTRLGDERVRVKWQYTSGAVAGTVSGEGTLVRED